MAVLHIVVLALIQGITEFLPISSHAHLRLVHMVGDWPDPGLVIYVALHIGTLGAVLVYFWRDMLLILGGLARSVRARGGAGTRLLANLSVATIPVVVAGYFVFTYVSDGLFNAEVIAWATIAFAIFLYAADRLGMTIRRIEHMHLGSALAIGIVQVLALVPGTSRSGVTMTAARMLGFERREAARFSLLMSVPVILLSGALATREIYQRGDIGFGVDALIAAGLAFVAALAAIALLMRWLERMKFTPFVIYRLALGAGLLYWIYA